MKYHSTIIFILFSLTILQGQRLDSLLRITENTKDTNAVMAYYEIGKFLFHSNRDSCNVYFQKGEVLAEKLNFDKGRLLNLRSLGSSMARMGQYEEALAYLGEGMNLIESKSLPIINKVDFLINTGAAHYYAGFTGKAIEPYIEAVEICRENNFDDKRGMLLNNLGIFYRSLNRYEEAIQIYDEAYELREKIGDKNGMGNIAHNRATTFSKLGDYDSALKSIKEAKAIFLSLNQSEDVILCDLAAGTFLIDLKRFDEAASFLTSVSSDTSTNFELSHLNNLYQGLAQIDIHRQHFNSALKHLNIIENEILSSDLSQKKSDFCYTKALALEGNGQYKMANEYLKKYINISEEQISLESQELLKEMETKYLSVEKDFEIKSLNAEKEISSVKLAAANQRNLGLGIGLVIFGLLAFLLYKMYGSIKKKNMLLSKALSDNKILLKEIHHRVKNNLQVVSSLLGLQSRYVESSSALDAIKTGRSRVQSMSLLHQNLYRNENLKSVNIKKYFEDLGQNLFSNYRLDNKQITFETDIDEMEIDIDIVVPMGLITNELISNALKYAFKGRETGKIFLTVKKVADEIVLRVKDNGVGIPFTQLPDRSESLGMQLIKSFSHKLQANVDISNSNGTDIQIRFDPRKIVVAAA